MVCTTITIEIWTHSLLCEMGCCGTNKKTHRIYHVLRCSIFNHIHAWLHTFSTPASLSQSNVHSQLQYSNIIIIANIVRIFQGERFWGIILLIFRPYRQERMKNIQWDKDICGAIPKLMICTHCICGICLRIGGFVKCHIFIQTHKNTFKSST